MQIYSEIRTCKTEKKLCDAEILDTKYKIKIDRNIMALFKNRNNVIIDIEDYLL